MASRSPCPSVFSQAPGRSFKAQLSSWLFAECSSLLQAPASSWVCADPVASLCPHSVSSPSPDMQGALLTHLTPCSFSSTPFPSSSLFPELFGFIHKFERKMKSSLSMCLAFCPTSQEALGSISPAEPPFLGRLEGAVSRAGGVAPWQSTCLAQGGPWLQSPALQKKNEKLAASALYSVKLAFDN